MLAEAGKVAIVLKVGTSEMGAQAALRAHGRNGRLRSDVLGDAAVLQRDPGGRLQRVDRAPGGVLAPEPAARDAGSAPSPTPAARASTSPTRPSRRGCRCQLFSPELTGRDQGRVPELLPRRQSGRLLGDRRRSRRVPAGVRADGRVGRVRRAGERDRPQRVAARRRARAGDQHRRRPAGRVRRQRPVSRACHRHDCRPAARGHASGRARTTSRCSRAPCPGCGRWPRGSTTGSRARRPRATPAARRSPSEGALAELESAEIARAYGLDYVRAERCASADEAVAAAERIGYPVVVKVDNVAHKARVGGVALNLIDAAAVREAAERMGGRVIVAEQVLGRSRGAGGGGARLRLRRHRRGRRGRRTGRSSSIWSPPAWRRWTMPARADWSAACRCCAAPARRRDPRGLMDAIVAVSRLAAEHPEIAEIDVNPLLVSAERAVALDCLIVLGAFRGELMSDCVCTRSAARPPGSRSTGRRS